MEITNNNLIYLCRVLSVFDDNEGLRIKVRIPQLHGFINKESYGPVDQRTVDNSWVDDMFLPWASVCFPFGSVTQPEINQVVWVAFVNGDPNHPVIIGWAGYDYTDQEEILTAQ